MKRKKIDNFLSWRNEMKRLGKIRSKYPDFRKDGNLAELIGVIWGDGHIGKFPRTEVLRIFSNASNRGFVNRYANLIEKIFEKKPSVIKRTSANCINITIYQKYISKRLGIPTGAKGHLSVIVPRWIMRKRAHIIRFLRGLYEAEGSFCIHKPTYTYKLFFSNKNAALLENVFRLLKMLKFHPNKSKFKVQISRKEEVFWAKELLGFRVY